MLVRSWTLGAGDERVSRWRRTRWKHAFELQPHTHTQLQRSYQRLPNRTYVEMIASHNYSPPRTGAMALQRSKRYLDAQWRLPWHKFGLQEQEVNRENYSRTLAYWQLPARKLVPHCKTHAFSSLGVAWLYVPHPEYVNRSHRSWQTRAFCILGEHFLAVACQS